MTLAIFDLDETLIRGDCASLWSERMCALAWAERAAFMQENDALMAAYGQGRLAMEDYMRFSLAPLRGRSVEDVAAAVERFVDAVIEPRIYPEARRTVAAHRARGDRLLVISASGAHLVRPIARRLGIDEVLAIDLDVADGVLTGQTRGTLTYREGKVTRLDAWLQVEHESLAGASFYSDSRNDLPLLMRVDRPHAVNADAVLSAHARAAGWPQLRW
ncbi:HAD-IB family hydrolase [Robbsia sp. Bb-Pol-6]|uniref:HAD-IB family hydrolase n=1 Tax=Robbsia betulipollinis TaxID=2981849 RepID=A0ABT3ZIL0_9BURK|nr:HAD family hydrolase [Robbsia betulipollinis]MCY0386145.1 HAD-IB family hydrolase [Robbsia betulipollinis]